MITLKSLLHLRQKVITFRTLLHLGLLQHLSRSTPAEESTSYATNCFQVAEQHCNTVYLLTKLHVVRILRGSFPF